MEHIHYMQYQQNNMLKWNIQRVQKSFSRNFPSFVCATHSSLQNLTLVFFSINSYVYVFIISFYYPISIGLFIYISLRNNAAPVLRVVVGVAVFAEIQHPRFQINDGFMRICQSSNFPKCAPRRKTHDAKKVWIMSQTAPSPKKLVHRLLSSLLLKVQQLDQAINQIMGSFLKFNGFAPLGGCFHKIVL